MGVSRKLIRPTFEEPSLVAPYLLLQREHNLGEVFNGLRYIARTGAPWR
jgi:transposase